MLSPSLLTASLFVLATGALAQSPTEAVLARTNPMGTAVTLPPSPIVGSDSCTTPTLVVGNGPHSYDTTGATTGPEGQSTTNCIFSNSITIENDVWFEWVATATGTFELTTCALAANDTKIAVYTGTSSGTSCPLAGGMAAACNDDLVNVALAGGNLLHLRSRVTFAATGGTHYLIQVGNKAGTVPGPGQFQIDQVIVQPPYTRHDGSIEVVFRLNPPATDSFWMQAQGDATTGMRTVTAVKSAAGATFVVATSLVVDGNPITIAVLEDPNDDGNPNDAILLTTFTTTVSLANTDMLATYPLPTPVTVNNVFFVAASYSHGSGAGFPIPMDSNGCASRPQQAWLGGNAGPVDFLNLAANTYPPGVLTATANVAVLIEADTISGETGTVFCIGDGVAPHTACPCGNNSATIDGVGCLHSGGTGGKLRGSGVASISNDTLTLVGSQMTSSSVLYFQGTTQQNAGNGSVFGDGLRCAGGAVIRLGTTVNVGGASTYPFGAFPPVSVRGSVLVPGVRTYQGWYRNAAAFCTVSTFNLTNGLEIIWIN